jgi:hypothetical protein
MLPLGCSNTTLGINTPLRLLPRYCVDIPNSGSIMGAKTPVSRRAGTQCEMCRAQGCYRCSHLSHLRACTRRGKCCQHMTDPSSPVYMALLSLKKSTRPLLVRLIKSSRLVPGIPILNIHGVKDPRSPSRLGKDSGARPPVASSTNQE